nr:hypothetical protein GCM10020093_014480 [Planobispora longispora]
MIRRYAPVAAAVNDFYWDLFGSGRTTPYPREKIERALRSALVPIPDPVARIW